MTVPSGMPPEIKLSSPFIPVGSLFKVIPPLCQGNSCVQAIRLFPSTPEEREVSFGASMVLGPIVPETTALVHIYTKNWDQS